MNKKTIGEIIFTVTKTKKGDTLYKGSYKNYEVLLLQKIHGIYTDIICKIEGREWKVLTCYDTRRNITDSLISNLIIRKLNTEIYVINKEIEKQGIGSEYILCDN